MKIHFVSLGCPKNRVDTEVMAAAALARGLELTAEPEQAEIIVVNTCGFIGDAKEESVNALIEMGAHRTDGRCELLIATGCLSQRYPEDLAREMPELDVVVGTQGPAVFGEILDGVGPRVRAGRPGHFLQGPGTKRFVEPGAPFAYVKIADGCSRKCAFCAIPGIRGKARSRPVNEIVEEARTLAERGVKELNLVSQDTTDYGKDLPRGNDLPSLIRALDRVDGIAWVRLHYLYPTGVDDALLEAMARSNRTVPYLDVPIQHASTDVLRRMHRGHGRAQLEEMVERIRERLPEAFLRTTVLVGHPGETADDFRELLEFVEQVGFDHLGVFRYSDEEGTTSFGRGPTVSGRDSYNRFRKLMAVQRKISKKRNKRLLGSRVEVLVEGFADERGYVLLGRHRGQAPEVDGDTYLVSSSASVGDVVRGVVVEAKEHDLVVEPLEIS